MRKYKCHFRRWILSVILLGILITIALGCTSSPTTTTTSPTTTTISPTTTLPTTTQPTTTLPTTTQPTTTIPTTTTSGQTVTVDLSAQNISFDKSTITVPANSNVKINFNNKDSGIMHNFALYTNSSGTTPIFVGDIIVGPKTIVYSFTAPGTPGTYFFRCDPHAGIMMGNFIVQ